MRIALATGRKAEEMVKDAVRDAVAATPQMICETLILTQEIEIAAFTTPKSLKKALEKDGSFERPDTDLILVSGLCKSDFSQLEKEIATPIRLGPRQTYEIGEVLQLAEAGVLEFSPKIPADAFLREKRRMNAYQRIYELESNANERFGLKNLKIGGGSRMKVCAEIVDATLLSANEIERIAEHYLKSGADILDIGVHIGAKPDEVERAVKTLRSFAPEMPISIDTLNPELIRTGIENCVDMVLSLNKDNIPEVAAAIAKNKRDIAAVVIPSYDSACSDRIDSLFTNLKMAEENGIKRIIADPVLNAIGYGIAESLYNYYLFRLQENSKSKSKSKSYPLFFGVGNVTELMDADSVGVNATLAGIASELSADILFTTECSDKTRGSVRELRTASEMMMLSKAWKSVPKDVGIDLLILKEKKRTPLKKIQDKDPNVISIIANRNERWELDPEGYFRIDISECDIEQDSNGNGRGSGKSEKKIFARHSPTGKEIVGESAEAIMDTILRLGLVSLPGHISYLSRELTKAEHALRLDRSYEQDEPVFHFYKV